MLIDGILLKIGIVLFKNVGAVYLKRLGIRSILNDGFYSSSSELETSIYKWLPLLGKTERLKHQKYFRFTSLLANEKKQFVRLRKTWWHRWAADVGLECGLEDNKVTQVLNDDHCTLILQSTQQNTTQSSKDDGQFIIEISSTTTKLLTMYYITFIRQKKN